jgi:tetratricopeptide (TPR) repeat protein
MRRFLSILLRLLLPPLIVIGLSLSPRPTVLDLAYSAAHTARQRGWTTYEVGALQQIAEYQPWLPGLWERMGVEALASDQLDIAVHAFQQAEQQVDLSVPARVAYGEALWQRGDHEAAIAVWMPLFVSGQAEAWLFDRAAIHQRSAGERAMLLEVLRMWSAAHPGSAAAEYELGVLLLPEEPDEALQVLQKAGRSDPDLRGVTYPLEQAIKTAAGEQNSAYGQVLLGRALASSGEWAAAERTFAYATQIEPGYAEAWAFLAEARQWIGKDGQDEITAALSADPHSVSARTLAALYWRRAGIPEKGLVYLEALAAEFPEQGLWQVEMAYTLAEMGKQDLALVHLQEAVLIEPGKAEYWRLLGRFCVDNYLEVREIGLPAARQALSLAPANPDMLDLMGLVLLQLGDEIGAERFLQRALQMNPVHAGAHLHLGQLYLNQANVKQAASHLRQARDSAGKNQPEIAIIATRLLEQYGFQ